MHATYRARVKCNCITEVINPIVEHDQIALTIKLKHEFIRSMCEMIKSMCVCLVAAK